MIGRQAVRLLLAVIVVLAGAAYVWAGQAQDQLKGAIDRVVATLDSPALRGDGKVTERRAAVRKIADEIFDFGEIALDPLAVVDDLLPAVQLDLGDVRALEEIGEQPHELRALRLRQGLPVAAQGAPPQAGSKLVLRSSSGRWPYGLRKGLTAERCSLKT